MGVLLFNSWNGAGSRKPPHEPETFETAFRDLFSGALAVNGSRPVWEMSTRPLLPTA